MLDVIFLIRERIAHAKPRQEYGVESLRTRRGVIFNSGFLMFNYWRVRKWESENVVPRVRDARMWF